MKNYVLRFISGKYQGGEFPLPLEAELIIGRSSDLDMVLVEDMVSRRHSKMTVDGEQIIIQDLGSTNGTFVNGERIKRARLNEGDRILVGTSIIKLVAVEPEDADSSNPHLDDVVVDQHSSSSQSRSMSGSIHEIPLPDLLQMFGTSRKSCVLCVSSDADQGKVFLDQGLIVFSSINENKELDPHKCAYRILTWRQGNFYIEPLAEQEISDSMDLSAEAVLMESMRIFDEVQRFGDELPVMRDRCSLVTPLDVKLSDLNSDELDVLQSAINFKMTETVFNNCPVDDIKIAQALVKLVSEGYLAVTRSDSDVS